MWLVPILSGWSCLAFLLIFSSLHRSSMGFMSGVWLVTISSLLLLRNFCFYTVDWHWVHWPQKSPNAFSSQLFDSQVTLVFVSLELKSENLESYFSRKAKQAFVWRIWRSGALPGLCLGKAAVDRVHQTAYLEPLKIQVLVRHAFLFCSRRAPVSHKYLPC